MVVIKNKDSPELQKMVQYQFHDHTHSHNLATNKNRGEKYAMHSLTMKKSTSNPTLQVCVLNRELKGHEGNTNP